MLRKLLLVLGMSGFAAMSTTASAAYVTYFGEDLNNSPSVRLASTPNASAASANFLASLIGVGTETFEGFANGTSAPLALTFPGAGTATLTGGGGQIATVLSGTNGAGRYPISGSNYWEVSAGSGGNFTISFSTPVAAFGFWGVDIGDFGGQLTLGLMGGGTTNITVNNTVGSNGSTDGSVLFFGVIGNTVGDLFTSVTFNTTTGQGDVFAFDDMTIGSLQQVRIVPLPGTLLLLGSALAGLGLMRRRSAIK